MGVVLTGRGCDCICSCSTVVAAVVFLYVRCGCVCGCGCPSVLAVIFTLTSLGARQQRPCPVRRAPACTLSPLPFTSLSPYFKALLENNGDFQLFFPTTKAAVDFGCKFQTALATAQWPSEVLDLPDRQEVLSGTGQILWRGLRAAIGVATAGGSMVTHGNLKAAFGPATLGALQALRACPRGAVAVHPTALNMLSAAELAPYTVRKPVQPDGEGLQSVPFVLPKALAVWHDE